VDESISRKSCATFSIPACSNSLNLNDSFTLTGFYASGKRPKGKREKRESRRDPAWRLLPGLTVQYHSPARDTRRTFREIFLEWAKTRDGKRQTLLMTIARKCFRQDRFRRGILCSATELASEMTRLDNKVRRFPSMIFDRRVLEQNLGSKPRRCLHSRGIGQHGQA
jgi:hypothetical protein